MGMFLSCELQNEVSTITAGELTPNTSFTATANIFTTTNTRYELISKGIYRTLDTEYYRPMQIRRERISVRYQLSEDNNLKATIRWKPEADMVCQYHLAFYGAGHTDLHEFGHISSVSIYCRMSIDFHQIREKDNFPSNRFIRPIHTNSQVSFTCTRLIIWISIPTIFSI